MGGEHSKGNISTTPTGTSKIMTAIPSVPHSTQRIVQNFLLVWIDANIDESNKDCQNTLTQLRSVVNDVKMIKAADQCMAFLRGIENEKAFVITSGSLGEHLVPDIHALPQLDTIYIFCANKPRHESWANKWSKVKDVYTDIQLICEALRQSAKQCDENSIPMSFVTVNAGISSPNLNQLEPSFMYTQIFKDILLEMEHDEKSIKVLTDYCRPLHHGNTNDLMIIDDFEHNYRSKSAIWWYTRECFTYKMLNRALRTLEGDTIINMGFFIRDLHQQLRQLHDRQIGSYGGKSFVVYRGQGLTKADFEKLLETKGGLMSFNNFLSTSAKRDVSLGFAMEASTKENMVGILFQMTIDPSVSSAPFASIQQESYFKTEKETLFSMHTVFRVGEITKIENTNSLYQANLRLTADDDQELRTLTQHVRKEVGGQVGWQRLGKLLIKLGQVNKAEELYSILLNQTSDMIQRALYYSQPGCIRSHQGNNKKAIECYEKALEIDQKTLPANHPSLATSYNNIGLVYSDMESTRKHFRSTKKHLKSIKNSSCKSSFVGYFLQQHRFGVFGHGRVLKSTFVLRKST